MLVGQSIFKEINIMSQYGIDLLDKEAFAIEGVLETLTLSKAVGMPFWGRPTLGMLCEALEVPFLGKFWHTAGNDACFTLRVLLALAAVGFEQIGRAKMAVEGLRSVALESIDFDEPTPDWKRGLAAVMAAKEAALHRKPKIKDSDGDWLNSQDDEGEGEFLGSTFFGMGDDL